MEQTELERVAEAILFAAGEPVELERIAMAAECDPDEAEQAVRSLMDRLSYERRGIRILRLEHAYQMCSSGEMSSYVTRALETRKPPRLSSAQLYEPQPPFVVSGRRDRREDGLYPRSRADARQRRGTERTAAHCRHAVRAGRLAGSCLPV